MEKYFITFRSITYAQKGERILKNGNLSCYLQRAPRQMAKRGCGYAVEVREPTAAIQLLDQDGAVWEKLYRQDEKGTREVGRI